MNYSDILHIYSILDGKYSDVFRGKVSPGTPKPATRGQSKPATCGHPKTSHWV